MKKTCKTIAATLMAVSLTQPRDHDATMDTIKGCCFPPHGMLHHECNLVFADTLHLQRPGADPALCHVTGTMRLLFCDVAIAFEWVHLWSSCKLQQKVVTQPVSRQIAHLTIGATPLPFQTMPLPSSERVGSWGDRKPPTMPESALFELDPASGWYDCALLLARTSSARLLVPKRMSLWLKSLISFLA